MAVAESDYGDGRIAGYIWYVARGAFQRRAHEAGRAGLVVLGQRGVAPQAIEAVLLAFLGQHHVHHDVDVVDEDPPPGIATLDVQELEPRLAGLVSDRIADRLHLDL